MGLAAYTDMLDERIIYLEAMMVTLKQKLGLPLLEPHSWLLPKKKAETPVKESRPICNHKTCTYEVGGRWNCEY